MDERLVKAAREGDVNTLLNLMEEDPEILERASSEPFADSPLHVAALYGRSDFVEQFVRLMPSLARETNQKGRTPLHLASLKGHVETVRELLKAKLDDDDNGVLNHQCLVKDEEGWTPLHCASQKGKIRVMEELISECSQNLEQITAKGETVLHVAVKANQFKAVKLLANSIRQHNLQILFKIQDQEGRTSYQLAEAKKQFQVLEVLKEDDEKEGDEIREEHSIKLEGITTIYDLEAAKKPSLVRRDEGKEEEKDEIKEEISINVDKEKQQLELLAAGFQNTGFLVATLILTLSYQGLANPPSTLFQPGTKIDWRCLSKFPPLSDYTSYNVYLKYFKSCPAYFALLFLVYNSIVFTLSICLLFWSVRGSHRFLLFLQFLAIFLVTNYCVLLGAINVYAVYATFPISSLCYAFFFYLLYKERGIAKIKLPWMGKLRGEK